MENKKQIVILIKGISGSGKSFWAADFLKNNPDFREVNRDNIRMSLYGQEKMWQGDEKRVTEIQVGTIKCLLHDGYNLVISDTNLNPKISNRLVRLANDYGAEVEWKDFTNVPLELCLERDAKRQYPVGESVIKRQYYKYIMGNEFYREPYLKPQDKSLPAAVIFDVDGTLTEGPHERSPYDMAQVMQDKPNVYVMSMLTMFVETGVRTFIFSGREEKAYDDTVEWLNNHLNYVKVALDSGLLSLHMRPNNVLGVNADGDDVVKERLYQEFVKDKFHVVAVFDDRLRVCKNVWYKHGLPLFRVGDPTADF